MMVDCPTAGSSDFMWAIVTLTWHLSREELAVMNVILIVSQLLGLVSSIGFVLRMKWDVAFASKYTEAVRPRIWMFVSSPQRANYFVTSRWIQPGIIKPGPEVVSEGSIVPAILRHHIGVEGATCTF